MAGWERFDPGTSPSFKPGMIEVRFKNGAEANAIDTFIGAVNSGTLSLDGSAPGRARYTFEDARSFADDAVLPRLVQFVSMRVPADKVGDWIEFLLKRGDVQIAKQAPRLIGASTPDDHLIGTGDVPGPNDEETQWYLHRCKIVGAWATGLSGANVVVADIDLGFRRSHIDIASRIERFVPLATARNPVNDLRHGTGVLGIIGGEAFNDGICGVAWGSALWAVQAGSRDDDLSATGDPTTNSWAEGIKWATHEPDARNRRRVINIEAQAVGGYNALYSVAIQGVVERALGLNIVVCIAAGNGAANVNEHLDNVPPAVILVGSTLAQATNELAVDSNWGVDVSTCAPGDSSHDVTCGSGSDNEYVNFGGTSGAAAKIAGVIALLLQANERLTPLQIRKLLQYSGSAVVVQQGRVIGGTFVDCLNAVDEARRLKTFPVVVHLKWLLLHFTRRVAAFARKISRV